ncbi:helix-turn-helix transcriptional regulator [Halorussus halophilus]|uniref:helix-turn-helix transcriptional regulator n=1 Tax=Halorussus halophilus TaxID=2650975 RepID=UPI001CE49513|nr:hypothetical protein [Halorussus halophilus]
MRWSAALFVSLLLVPSAVVGAGVGQPTDHTVSDQRPALNAVNGTAANGTGTAANGTTANGTDKTSNATNETVRDGTTMYISLRSTGSAHWNVTARFHLQDENETEAFESLAREYERGSSDVGFSADTFETIADRAAENTSREMAIRNVSRSGRITQNGSVGVLRMSFTWTNFTRTSGRQVMLGDVFTTESGLWLPALTEKQTLVIDPPEDYQIYSGNPHLVDGKIRYEGPKRFTPADLTVTFNPNGPGNTPTPDDGPWGEIASLPGIALLVILVGLGGGGVYMLSQRDSTPPTAQTEPTDTDDRSERPVTSSPDSAEADDTEESDESSDEERATELLSDEERVMRLLDENDGRMKQGTIVKETNWSHAKVSQLLSKMNDEGRVDKLRIGRENLITLPDEDVTDTD